MQIKLAKLYLFIGHLPLSCAVLPDAAVDQLCLMSVTQVTLERQELVNLAQTQTRKNQTAPLLSLLQFFPSVPAN